MKSTSSFRPLTFKFCVLAFAIVLMLGTSAEALHMTKMPKELQTAIVEPCMRTIVLKLPLRQPVFHWRFQSKKDLLAGKLLFRISRNEKTTEIVIFENGRMSEGWEPMALPDQTKNGEIYFGFQSSEKFATAPNDTLAIELIVKEDLAGIGSLQTGVLPAGTYKAQGSYSGLLDEYQVFEQMKNIPKETLEKLRKSYEHKAFLENWESQWPLRITGNKGWLPADQRQPVERMLEQMRKEEEATKKAK